jgi:hypothetical protein
MKPVNLTDAIRTGDDRAVDAAIAAGADVNALPATGHQPPLHMAIEHQRVAIARRLIEAGALVNRELSMSGWDFGGAGWTPLVHAIDIESDAAWQAHHETGHETTELTELLLASGAVPTKRAFQIAGDYGTKRPWRCFARIRARAHRDNTETSPSTPSSLAHYS